MDKGFIKLHRKILENHFLMHDEKAYIMFTKLLMMVGTEKGEWSGGRRQLADILRMNDSTVYKVLQRLLSNRLISVESNQRYSVIRILNWHKYQSVPNRLELDYGNQPVTNRGHSNKNKNNNINTTNVVLDKSQFGGIEINEMFDYWESKLGYRIEAKRQANRRACNNLIRKHGSDGLKKAINGVVLAANDRYAPRIADFTDLQTKWNELMLWGRKKQINRKQVIA